MMLEGLTIFSLIDAMFDHIWNVQGIWKTSKISCGCMVADGLKLQVAMVLLYLQLGVASLVALGSLILMMPVQVCCFELHTCLGWAICTQAWILQV